MATSTIDATVFMRWQLPSEYETPQSPERHQQLKTDFRRHFSPERPLPKKTETQQQQQQQQQQAEAAKQPHAGRSQLRAAIARQSLDHGQKLQSVSSSSGIRSHLLSHAERLLSDASEAERRVIVRALRLTQQQNERHSVDRCVDDAEVQRRVKDWMKTAAPADRRVAAEFFQKLAGSHLVEPDVKAKTEAVLKALKKLEKPAVKQQQQQQQQQQQEEEDSPRLRHLRLLTPGTRANRQQHTTWHHLPPKPEISRGNNQNSQYSRLSKPDAHYRIHPDWGWDAPQQQQQQQQQQQ